MFAHIVMGSILNAEMESALRRYERAQRGFEVAIALPQTNPDRSGCIKRAAELEALALQELSNAMEQLDRFNADRHVVLTGAEEFQDTAIRA